MYGAALSWFIGCACGLAWSSVQTAVLPPDDEPERLTAHADLVLVSSDGSPISKAIDDATGGLGYSHCFLDFGQRGLNGESIVVDYQPGKGVHWASTERYAARAQARVRFDERTSTELYGCVRAKIGQPFDAAGIVVGRETIMTCAGLVWSCLPLEIRRQIWASGRQIAPNDFARFFQPTRVSSSGSEDQ